MLETFTIDTFSGRLGQTFTVRLGDHGAFETQLVAATSLGPPPPEGRGPFSLVFRGPSDVLVPQRIYRVEHAELGAFELFLVPIGPDREGMRYEAVFT
jgi:hypothetical protein